MPLVNAKCTNCGAELEVDGSKDTMICKYCGSAFVVEQAINNYNVTNNINAEVVNIYGGQSDFDIRAGKLTKYNGAATEVVIPNTVKIIGREAFMDCVALTSVKIPDSVTEIEENAFKNCSSITEVVIPNSVVSIGKEAFMDCSSMTKLTLSNSLKEINTAFNNCTSLTSVIIPEGVSILLGAFCGCSMLESVELPKSLKNIKDSESVNEIGWVESTDSFSFCKELKSIDFPDDIEEIIGFNRCEKLKSIKLPNNLKKIRGFNGCNELQSITIPANVELIYRAFNNCDNLMDVNKSENIKIEDSFRNTPYFGYESKGGCYVATCVYGSYDCPQVWTLRRFRDYSLSKTWYGRAFIRTYYTISPTIVKWLGDTEWFKKMWRGKLDKIVENLQEKGFDNTPYADMKWR